jgi:hypothetical protein
MRVCAGNLGQVKGKIGNWKAYTLVGTINSEAVNYNSTWREGPQNLRVDYLVKRKFCFIAKPKIILLLYKFPSEFPLSSQVRPVLTSIPISLRYVVLLFHVPTHQVVLYILVSI